MSFRRLCLFVVCLISLSPPLHAETRAERVQQRIATNPDLPWYEAMDTGPFISDTFLGFGPKGDVAVLKGIAIQLEEEGSPLHTVVFDTELLRFVAGFEGKVTLAGTPWDAKHGGNSSLPAERERYCFATNIVPGWDTIAEGDWRDPRPVPNGPLPREKGQYLGLYRHGDQVVLHYRIGDIDIWEHPSLVDGRLSRTFHIDGNRSRKISVLLNDHPSLSLKPRPATLDEDVQLTIGSMAKGGRDFATFAPSDSPTTFQVIYSAPEEDVPLRPAPDVNALTLPAPPIFPESVTVSGRQGKPTKGFAVDTLPLPLDNPWASNIRFGGFDFFPDGKRAACSTWNGDVWIVDGLDGDLSQLTWHRYAAGLYQTLGVKIVNGVVYTQGRDQITRLHDLNEDGEADYYECLNNEVQITKGFHEFSFDLETDREGNFYFSKGMPVLGGGRGFAPWTPHNGAILKVAPDGSKLERVAWGLRAPGGIGVSPTGILTTGENEGSWVPRCKITWSKPGELPFHGVVPSEWDNKAFVKVLPDQPSDYEKPLCWLPYYVDNSSGSQTWVPEGSDWAPHAGKLLHLSYGKSSIYRVLEEEVNGQIQGGVYRLPIELTSAVMRSRFHPQDGSLFAIGFRGWQTNGGTGLHRIRFTGHTTPVPTSLEAHENGVIVRFSDALEASTAEDPRRYAVSKWDYVWGPMYGSGRFSIDNRKEEVRQTAWREPSKGARNEIDTVPVRAAKLLPDGKSIFLYVPEMTPAMQMEIKMDLASAEGAFRETIWNTIHHLRPSYEDHGLDLDNLPVIDTAPIGKPGLILSLAAGSTDDAVVVDHMAITLDQTMPTTPFIDPKRIKEMVFTGSLALDARDALAFRILGTGWASLKIDGQIVIEGELPLEAPPLLLEPGSHAVFCNFRRLPSGEGRMQLQWSGEQFTWEPVPGSAFRHLPNDLVESKDRIRQGRDLFAQLRCVQCHQPKKALEAGRDMPELLEDAPDFHNMGNRLQQAWIESWVRKPRDFCPSIVPDEAPHIAAYLASVKTEELKAHSGNPKKGEELAQQLHLTTWISPLTEEPRHTAAGLQQFLREPAKHHPATPFPDLGLSAEEAGHLAAWIQEIQPEAVSPSAGDPAKGKEIVTNRCLSCHEPNSEVAYEYPASSLEDLWNEDWMQKGCLSEEEGYAPELGLSLEQKQALIAFRNADSNAGLRSLHRFAPHEYAHRTMNALRCTECHSGQNTLPSIDLAGAKFRREWLTELFAGHTGPIRPWQQARMPAFESRAAILAEGLARAAGETMDCPLETPDPAITALGETMSGFAGYACTTCHAAGNQKALQAFEGQGPNLSLSAQRLRPDYYQRWMHWPQRFVPTTIMPKYTVDKHTALNPNFLDANSTEQFAALWQWMQTLEEPDPSMALEAASQEH